MTAIILRTTLCSLLFANLVFAAVPSTCNRGFSENNLSPKKRSLFESGNAVFQKNETTDSGFIMVYAMKKIKAAAELGMGISTAFDEQRDHVASVEDSKLIERSPGYYKVSYEIILGSLIPNSHFVSDTTLKREEDGSLIQEWKLNSSTGFTKLYFADGFMKYIPRGPNESTLVYCSYNVPSLRMAMDLANDKAYEGTISTVNDTVKWIEETARNQDKADRYVSEMLPFVVDSRM